ncbi:MULTISPECIES: hypothetical protein [Halorussus]|uniref:hypothetical protein n=1 Tax=Halorussus TaxID=1070314 RepID=UPI000E20EB58|nr:MULTISPECIES: hypothetical protein [Halorussus]NHN60911.1 hypothetical protein [Halorussus sp. JP-T4]
MRRLPHYDPPRHRDPAYTGSIGPTLVAWAVLALATVAAVVAVHYPIAAAGTTALAVPTWLTARTLRRVHRTRRRTGRTSTVCVPKIGLCVEV